MADTTGSGTANCVERLKTYAKTQKGVILAGEILVSFIVLICFAASMYGGYSALAICEIIFAGFFFGIFMMELDKKILVVNWVWSDLFRAGIGAVLYIITALINFTGGAGDGARIAGAVFCLIAALIFAYDTYTVYLQVRGDWQHSPAPTDNRV